MEPATLPPNASLQEVLSDRAKHATPRRLGIDVVGGGLVAAVATWARPTLWGVVASAAACLCFYGLWAVADRQLATGAPPSSARHELPWFVLRFVSGLLGLAAFVALLLTGLRAALGTIIS